MEYKPLNLLDSIFQMKKLDINKIRQLQIFLFLGNAPSQDLADIGIDEPSCFVGFLDNTNFVILEC